MLVHIIPCYECDDYGRDEDKDHVRHGIEVIRLHFPGEGPPDGLIDDEFPDLPEIFTGHADEEDRDCDTLLVQVPFPDPVDEEDEDESHKGQHGPGNGMGEDIPVRDIQVSRLNIPRGMNEEGEGDEEVDKPGEGDLRLPCDEIRHEGDEEEEKAGRDLVPRPLDCGIDDVQGDHYLNEVREVNPFCSNHAG